MNRLILLVTVPLALVASCSSGHPTVVRGTSTPTVPPGTSAPSGGTPTAGQTPVSAEQNPPGDIPDGVKYIPYTNRAGRYTFTHPESWAETTSGATVTFTDKLNGVHAQPGKRTSAATVDSAKSEDVPALQRSEAAFELRSVTAFSASGGSGVRIVYRRNSAADPVTGRQYRDEVERYELVAKRHEVVIELYGPVGADNVDAYKAMISSLTIA